MLKVAFDKVFRHPLDKNHRFPMEKYDLIPLLLINEKVCNQNNFFVPINSFANFDSSLIFLISFLE